MLDRRPVAVEPYTSLKNGILMKKNNRRRPKYVDRFCQRRGRIHLELARARTSETEKERSSLSHSIRQQSTAVCFVRLRLRRGRMPSACGARFSLAVEPANDRGCGNWNRHAPPASYFGQSNGGGTTNNSIDCETRKNGTQTSAVTREPSATGCCCGVGERLGSARACTLKSADSLRLSMRLYGLWTV